MLTADVVLARVDSLARYNQTMEMDRWRIRSIMNGGPEGIRAIMAWDQGKGSSGRLDSVGDDFPGVNMMASGVDRLAQKVGQAPTLKMPYGPRDSDAARERAEKKERVVEGWDAADRMELQYPQIGRWLPGYGYYSWIIRWKLDRVTRQHYPSTELRDPFSTWPGYFGPTQRPNDVCYKRMVPLGALYSVYPDEPWGMLEQRIRGYKGEVRYSAANANGISWEGPKTGICVIEYVCDDGQYVVIPEAEYILDYVPSVTETGPLFVFGKRVSFDRLISQYHHSIGLSAMQAKLNILSLIVAEDSSFRETNVIGEMEGDTYDRGRFAINFFKPGTRVEKPTGDNAIQLFQIIDRVERQLRISAAYDEGSDSLAARGGFITGQGQRELRDPIDANIAEYQKVIKVANEELDTRRLELDEKMDARKRKRVFFVEGDRAAEETYVPATDIGGNYRSRREYGVMASWDDNSKIVAGLQLLQAGIIDREAFQENLHGMDEATKMNQRQVRQNAIDGMMAMLNQAALEGDAMAKMAVTEIADNPQDQLKILKKFFTPSEPQMSPEEMAMAQGGMGPMPGGGLEELPSQPPSVQTILSRVTGGGQAESGVQTVGTNVR